VKIAAVCTLAYLGLLETCEMLKRMQYLKDVTTFFWQTLEMSLYNINKISIMKYNNTTVKIYNYIGSHIDNNHKSKRAHKARH
jgi:hypothetical protein